MLRLWGKNNMAYVKKMSFKSEEIVNFLRKSRRIDKNEIQYIHRGTRMQNVYDKVFLEESDLLGVKNYIGKLQRVLEETDPFRWK
ncbi:hypothetical protein SAMN05216412_102294 [Nitrosospira multiformis]|uniref:Uncharacterized protein n=1 Tax=Nitrosospira multiformis TaxID=1231 RepID=A0A1I0AKR2_9PROT|nr:hypothetical protein SAMN05216412_102294 [Nitrosospira multiformis]